MRVEVDDSCPGCGWAIEVESPPPPEGYQWWATDGDPAYCSRTGIVTGFVSADSEEDAWINTDCLCDGPEYGCGCPYPCEKVPE